jgi:hypothetical protein
MTRAHILLTRAGKKSVCVIDSSAYPGSLPEILTHFDDWVSESNELRINAEYVYEINFDTQTVRGWKHVCKDWSTYTIQQSVKKSIATLIRVWLPRGWKLNRDKEAVRFSNYGISDDGSLQVLETCQPE